MEMGRAAGENNPFEHLVCKLAVLEFRLAGKKSVLESTLFFERFHLEALKRPVMRSRLKLRYVIERTAVKREPGPLYGPKQKWELLGDKGPSK